MEDPYHMVDFSFLGQGTQNEGPETPRQSRKEFEGSGVGSGIEVEPGWNVEQGHRGTWGMLLEIWAQGTPLLTHWNSKTQV